MKILMFITGLGMGGAEKVVCELADKLYEFGHEVNIVYFTGEILRKPLNQNINIYKIPLNLNISIFSTLNQLIRLVDKLNPDVLHAHMFHANILARYVKMFRKEVRVICSSHSNYEGGRIRMAMYSITENLCDVHTNVSYNAAKALMKAGAVRYKEIIAVYNGIDINKYKFDENLRNNTRKKLAFSENSNLIIAIGRIDTPKDYPTLLKAYKIVREMNNNTFLLIVGDGPKKQEIQDLSKSLGIHEYVVFLGIRNDVPDLLNACDLFVSSSAWEGFGIAILEAMISTIPIVATNTDGARELLNQDLIEVGNYKNLAAAINVKLRNKINNSDFSKLIYRFDWNKIIENWLDIYGANR